MASDEWRTDRPDNDRKVLVLWPYGDYEIACYWRSEGGWFSEGRFWRDNSRAIWCELPPPPKGVGNG